MGFGDGSATGGGAVALAFLSEDLFGTGAFLGTEDPVSVGVKALDQRDFPLALKNLVVGLNLGDSGLTGLQFFLPEGLSGHRALLRAENPVTIGVKAGEKLGFPLFKGGFFGVEGEEKKNRNGEDQVFHGREGAKVCGLNAGCT